MSILSKISDLTLPGWVPLLWKATPYIIILVLFAGLMITRSTLHDVRLNDKLITANAATAVANQKASDAERARDAASNYAASIQDRQPIILHNTDTVHEYSQTPAGAAPCLAPDRVSGINDTRKLLFPSAPSGGTKPVPSNPTP